MKRVLIEWLKALALALGGVLAVTVSTITISFGHKIATQCSTGCLIAFVLFVILDILFISLCIYALVRFIRKRMP